MQIQTTELINGIDVTDIEHTSFAIEDYADDELNIFFSTYENGQVDDAIVYDQFESHLIDK